MSDFVLWVTAAFALELVCKLAVLGSGSVPQRTTKSIAIDSLILTCFIGWGVYVLAK